jgi:hypothetical protein
MAPVLFRALVNIWRWKRQLHTARFNGIVVNVIPPIAQALAAHHLW